MSQHAARLPYVESQAPQSPATPTTATSFLAHAKLISLLTLASRILGLLRETLAAKYFGAGLISTAFAVAFTIPNLFRRLFGEGALSAAFIPLYAQALKHDDPLEARRFASSAVNLLIVLLIATTLLGEAFLAAIYLSIDLRPDRLLALKLTAVMLPYVLLICSAAFLGGILQTHRRFAVTAASPILLNLALISATILGARLWDMRTPAGQSTTVYFLSAAVLLAGFLQVLILLPGLRAIGFVFDLRAALWTPAVRNMLRLSVPVALAAAVLQISTLLDRGISLLLARPIDQTGNLVTHFTLFGHSIAYPLEFGAPARLAWAQYLYQFPLGVFAIALATAIFPTLSADALEKDRGKFVSALRQGLRVTLWEGLPCSVGLVLVARPAVQLLFERGRFTPHDTDLVTSSVRIYALAIWAFALQQIVGRAYYALHDTKTPFVMAVLTLLINLIVELPLVWTMGEAGMAVGTTASFIVQTALMLYVLRRRTGPDLALPHLTTYAAKVAIATTLMAAACIAVQYVPAFPRDPSRSTALLKLLILVPTGAVTYLATCAALGIGGLKLRINPAST